MKQFMQMHFSLWIIYKPFNFILHKGVELVIYLFIYSFIYDWVNETSLTREK